LADQGPPRVIQGLDVRTLPLSPEEAFVLSRIDGRTAAADIALATGLPESRVVECLRRLQGLGAIGFEGAPGVPPVPTPDVSPQSSAPPRRHSSVRLRPAVEEASVSATAHPASLSYDPALLDEPCDLDRERKKLILDRFHALDQLTHYSILEVAEDASKEEIKEAYYLRVGVFHPDRYFGKDLGSFKPKLERVFGALTKAYDTLTRRRSREEYDRYLAARRRTAPLRPSLPPTRLTPAPGPMHGIPPAASAAPAAPPPSASEAPRVPTPAPLSSGAAGPPSDPEAARRALARKLRGSRPSIPPPPKAPSVDSAAVTEAVTEDLKARYAKRLEESGAARLDRYRKLAEEALQAGHFPSAVNALKVALSVAPGDPELTELLARTQEQADIAHADQFLEQARYEEKDGRLASAAQAYERAARGKKSASLYDRAAVCLIEAGTEPRKAIELARKAVDLEANRGQYRLTLARAYHLANLPASASSEIRRAAELAPDSDEIKTWLKRLR
jgi:curved DNA-binding protein CbpA